MKFLIIIVQNNKRALFALKNTSMQVKNEIKKIKRKFVLIINRKILIGIANEIEAIIG